MARKVLLIEDDPDMRLLLERFLGGPEFEVTAHSDVSGAIAALDGASEFDVVLVDFWLGQRDAVPILDRLAERLPSASIVLISGGGGGMTLEATKAVGALSGVIRFLQKPFSRKDLFDAIG